jgi:pimeloyl-ACP methyl ester carboxylesterase
MVPPKNAKALQDALSHAQTVTIAECGHNMMTEAPDRVLDALREFVGALG